MNLTPEQKKVGKIALAAVGGVACLVAAPFTMTLITGAAGIAVAAGLGLTAFTATPWLISKAANTRVKLLTGEARKNPIETMNNIYLENCKTLKEKNQRLIQFEARLLDFRTKMDGFKVKYPEEAARYGEIAGKMELVLNAQKEKQGIAVQAAKEYHDQIVKAEAIYGMAVEAHAVSNLAGNMEKQVFDDIRQRVAFESVTHAFNTAVAQLNNIDLDMDFALPAPNPVKMLPSSASVKALPESRVIEAELV